MSEPTSRPSVVVVGGGVAGLNAALYTARAGFETTVVNAGESILSTSQSRLVESSAC